MNKTAVMIGGTFNPVTIAHLAMGDIANSRFPDADVIYVPSNLNFMKHWKTISEQDRWFADVRRELLEICVKDKSNQQISYIEADGVVDGKTINSLLYFLEHGYTEVYIAFGADKIRELEYWYDAEKLMELGHFLLFHRDDIPIDLDATEFLKKHKDRFEIISAPIDKDVSSSAVRQAFFDNDMDSVRGFITEEVWNYLNNIIERKS